MENLVFYTINPHYKEYSLAKLADKFKITLQRYYRKTLGARYHHKKNEQFPLYIFQEETTNAIKEPHLHIIIDIPEHKRDTFFTFMNTKLKEIYVSLTYDIQPINPTKADLERIITYCTKEDNPILGNEDLY